MSADGSNSWSSDVAEPPGKEHFQIYGKPNSVHLTNVILVNIVYLRLDVCQKRPGKKKKDTTNMILL